MSRSGNKTLRPPLAALAAVVAFVFAQWVFPIGAQVAGASPAAATWSTLSPPAGPPALAYAAQAYDPATQSTVLFGGVDPNGNLSDATWIWDGTTWHDQTQFTTSPAPRESASLAYFPGVAGQTQGQLILFGGAGAGDAPLGDTWAWNGRSWVPMSDSSSAGPAPRFGASLAEDATGDLVLFGGAGSGNASSRANSAATLTTPPQTTTAQATTSTPGQSTTHAASSSPPSTSANPSTPATQAPPAPRPTATGSAVATASVTVDGTTTFSDTWVWNGSGWSQPNIMTGPPSRAGASLVWDPQIGQTVLFGGSATPTAIGPATPLGDTWVWSGSAWTQVKPTRSPPARYDAASGSAGALGGDVLIGGNNGLGPFSDQWSFSSTGDTWIPLAVNGTLTARAGAAAAGDPSSGGLMVFGGVGAGGNLDDTTVLSATPPLQVTTTVGGGSTNGSQPGTSGPPTEADGNGSTSSTPGSSASDPASPASRATSTTRRGVARTSATDRATTTGQKTSVSDEPGSHARIISGGGPGTGGTEPPATGQSGLTTSPPLQTVHTGSLVTVLGSGFEPGALVTITFHSRPYTIGKTRAGPDGTFSATVTVPLEASPGHHHLEASGIGPQGRMTVLLTPIVVLGKATHSLGGTSTRTKLIMVGIAVLLPAATWVITGIWSKRRRGPMAAS